MYARSRKGENNVVKATRQKSHKASEHISHFIQKSTGFKLCPLTVPVFL